MSPWHARELTTSISSTYTRPDESFAAWGKSAHHHGVHYDGPLVDDHVVEAVLAVRHEERDTPIEWKPLMKAAMKNLLPDDYLRRTNKVGGSPQSLRGYAANYDQLVAIWEESGDSSTQDSSTAMFSFASPNLPRQSRRRTPSIF